MLKRFKCWNEWRKNCLNSPLYKFLVLIGFIQSPTFCMFYPTFTVKYKEGIDDSTL